MRLLIHAGLHRTGTSSTQSTLLQISDQLLKHDIYFPKLSSNGNGYPLAYQVVAGNFSMMKKVIQDASKKISQNGIILISAEDFENLLKDTNIAKCFTLFMKENFKIEIEWIFVYRNQFEYFESIYARLCDTAFPNILNYWHLAKFILNNGHFSLNTYADNYLMEAPQLHFIFDYELFFKRFQSEIKGAINFLPFHEMHKSFSGAKILELCDVPIRDIKGLGTKIDNSKIRINKSVDDISIEYNYLAKFLNINPTEQFLKDNSGVIMPLINSRKSFKEKKQRTLRHSFKEAFGQSDFWID